MESSAVKIGFGNFEIDVPARVLLNDGVPVSLNSRAFDLLVELLRKPGEVLSKEYLLQAVWPNQFVEENNLTVQISALRKVLGGKKGDSDHIVTVPGRGYAFVAAVQASPAESPAKVNGAPRSGGTTGDGFVGRQKELSKIGELLLSEGVKLLTLTGAGGSGKTSLAGQAANSSKAIFQDGVYFIELAELREPEKLFEAIAEKLQLRESGTRPAAELVFHFLAGKKILLVLDNFEQILAAAHSVRELLDRAPDLKVMVTSRAPLKLKGEFEMVVQPLDVPPTGVSMNAQKALCSSSVQLFVDRARSTKSSFELTDDEAEHVSDICRRLDGLPLAIELAAARVRLLSPQSILSRLQSSLSLLTGGRNELPSRQQTIRDAIVWSYDLLDENERSVLRKLAVFAGGFTVEAAESVIGLNEYPTSVLDILTSLTENNLLFVRDQKNGEPRLAMLETIREFASEQLSQSGEGAAVEAKHAEYFTRMAEDAEPHLFSDRSVELLNNLEADIDNIRAALHFAKASDAGILIRLAGATRHFWIYRSHLAEGRMWLEAAIEKSATTERSARYKLLYGLGIIARLQGDYKIAEQAYLTALDESKDSENLKNIALLNSGLGTVLQLKGETARARMHFEEGLKLSRELGDDYSIAYSLLCLGIVLGLENKPKEARNVLEESLVILKRLGSGEAISNNLNNLGAVAFDDGDYEAARKYFSEGLEISQRVGNKVNITDALNGLAAIATKDRELELAARLAGAADKLGKSIGSNKEPAEQNFCDAYLAELRSSLDEVAFEQAFHAGYQLDADDVFALARAAAGSDGDFTEIVIDRKTVTEITIE